MKPGYVRLGPGWYVDPAGTLHCSLPELLDALGLAPTTANREWLAGVVEEALREQLPHADIRLRDTRPRNEH